MRFKSILIKNFFIVGEVFYSFEDRGLVLVSGENKDSAQYDSNGSGKTAVAVDALVWCLWGKTTRTITADEVVRDSGHNCEVIVDFEDEDGEEYRVVRYRKHKKFKNELQLFVNGQEVTGASASDTQELINGILGIDYNTFLNSVVFSQTAVKRFTEMTDKERKETLEVILSLDWLAEAYKNVGSDLEENNNDINSCLSSCRNIENQAVEIEKRAAKLREKSSKFEANKREKIKALEVELGLQIDRLEFLLDKLKVMPEVDIIILRKKVEQLTEEIKRIKAEPISLNKARLSIEKGVRKVAEKEFNVTSCKYAITEFENVGNTCSKCYQPVPLDFTDDVLSRLNINLCLATKKHKKVMEDLAKQRKSLVNLRDMHTKNVGRVESKLSESRGELITAGHSGKERLQLVGNIRQLKVAKGKTKKWIDVEKANVNEFSSLIEEERLELSEARDRLQKNRAKIVKLRNQQEVLEFWREAFSTKGIRSLLLDGVVQYLNRRLSRYSEILTGRTIDIEFSTLTTIKSGEVRDKFAIKTVNQSGAQVYSANSAGERRRIDLCVAFALCDLVASRSQKKFNILILDEVFDHLDEAGIDYVMSLLNVLSRDFESIFVITHNESLKSQFTNEIRVIREHGSARIEEL